MPQLDGLRGLAVAAVVFQHALPWVGGIIPFARLGVVLFFVLSGYLITRLLLAARDRAEADGRWAAALGRFYANRAVRIFPVYFLAVGLGLVLNVGAAWDIWSYLLTFTTNWVMAARDQWPDGYFHFWTLAVEEQFYLVWPLVVLFAPRKRLPLITGLLVLGGPLFRGLAVALGWNTVAIYTLTPACFDSLGAGALAALLGERAGASRVAVRWAIGCGVVGIGVMVAVGSAQQKWVNAIMLDLTAAGVFAVTVLSCATGISGWTGRILSFAPLTTLGRVSYGVYVYHVFIPALGVTLFAGNVDEESAHTPWAMVAASFAVIAAVVASWHLIEKPFLALRRLQTTSRWWLTYPVPAYAAAGAVLLAVIGWHQVEAERTRVWVARHLATGGAPGCTYYVSASGDDAADGTSPTKAWRTLARASATRLEPGSVVLLEGGQTFAGPLHLGQDDSGTPDQPVVIGSYGVGRAVIAAGAGDGVFVHNAMGVCIQDLVIIGDGYDTNTGSGVRIETDLRGDVKLPHLRVERVEASGFGRYGVLIDGNCRKSGFQDVSLFEVYVHHNALGGIVLNGEFRPSSRGYAHAHVTVANCRADDNPGRPGWWRKHSGNGIVLSDVDGALIEKCSASGNGGRCDSFEGGPVGIWVWDANRAVIRQNLSFGNRTGGLKDGGGFDLDGGVTNSMLVDNVSRNNDGAGYLLAQFPGARRFGENVVRNNVSLDDGRKNGYGGIHLWGKFADCELTGNQVSVSPAPSGRPAAVVFDADGTFTTRVRFRGNRLSATDGLPLVDIRSPQGEIIFEPALTELAARYEESDD